MRKLTVYHTSSHMKSYNTKKKREILTSILEYDVCDFLDSTIWLQKETQFETHCKIRAIIIADKIPLVFNNIRLIATPIPLDSISIYYEPEKVHRPFTYRYAWPLQNTDSCQLVRYCGKCEAARVRYNKLYSFTKHACREYEPSTLRVGTTVVDPSQ